MSEEWGHEIYVVIGEPYDDRSICESTGLRGFIDEDGDFIIPYADDTTAEEMCRILTGQLVEPAEGE